MNMIHVNLEEQDKINNQNISCLVLKCDRELICLMCGLIIIYKCVVQ